TGTARAIAQEPEVEVVWTADNPLLNDKAMRVAMPGRQLPADQAAEARGVADSVALRLRHHDAKMHAKNAPSATAARACYDAVERARYEAIGENNFAGMRSNLAAATERRLSTDPISRASTADDVPMAT